MDEAALGFPWWWDGTVVMVRMPRSFQNQTLQTGSRSPEMGFAGTWGASSTEGTSSAPKPPMKAQQQCYRSGHLPD